MPGIGSSRAPRCDSVARSMIGVLLSLALATWWWPTPVVAAHADDPRTLEDQLDLFLAWFPGRYDSALQALTDERDGVPEAERNYRRHSIFRRVDLPAFGEVAFYAEQYRDGDPDKVYRQRIYSFTLDRERQAIRLRVHVPNEVRPLRGAYRDPTLLAGLTPEAMTVWDGCDLWWRWEDDQFRGTLDPGACRFDSEAFGQEIVLDEYLLLRSDSIQFADRGLALDGSYLFGMRGDTPNLSRKVRPFLCDLDADGIATTAWIHDQGGVVETDAGRLVLQRWNVAGREPGAGEARGLRLTLTDGSGELLAEVGEPVNAEFIDMTHGRLAVACRHAPGAVYADGRTDASASISTR